VLMTAFVLVHRCGAVPDSHQVPFSVRQRRTPASPRLLRLHARTVNRARDPRRCGRPRRSAGPGVGFAGSDAQPSIAG